MAIENVISPNDGGGPPSDGVPVVLDKVNVAPKVEVTPAPTPTPTPAPKVEAKIAPKTEQVPPKVEQTPPPKTIGDDAPKVEDKVATPADWPDDWREKMAGDNKKLAERLKRMGSPKDLLNSWLGLEQRMSSGELKKALPDRYTEEELKEYRKSNGIPDKPEDYDINLGNGFVWGEADKPLLKDFTKFAHGNNIPQDMVKPMLGWYTAQQQAVADQTAERDELDRVNGGEALRTEWGKDFRGNLTATRNLFEGANATLWDVMMGARADDGTKLGNRPDILKFMASLSREINPYATLVPMENATPGKTAEMRYQELIKESANKEGPYWRGGASGAMQEEMRGLIDALRKDGRMSEDGRLKAA